MTRFSYKQGVCLIACLIALSSQTVTLATAWADEQAREVFLRIYQPHAAKLQSDYANIKIRYKETYNLGNGRVKVSEMEGKYNFPNFYLAGQVKDFDSKRLDKPVKIYREVECFNAHYSFALTLGSDNQYKVDNLKFGNAGVLCFFLAPCAEYQRGQTFLEMARDPSISFISFTDGDWQDRSLKELKVKFKKKFPDSKEVTEMSPSYFFSPEEGWICHGARYGTADPNVVYEKRFSYAPKNGERYPDLKSIEGWLKDIKNPKNSSRRHLTEIIEFVHSAPFAEAEFALSAFGLPDPMGVPSLPQSRTWLWLLATTIAAAALAMLFAWLKRRRLMAIHARTPTASPRRPT